MWYISSFKERKFFVLSLLFFLFFIALALNSLNSEARGGIAVSGSLYKHHFKMVPAESFSSPNVNMVVFNNYDKDINVRFSYDVPNGVKVDVEKENVVIPANQNIRFPVGLTLSEDVVPGEYRIGVAADVVPEEGEGISISGSAQIRTKLTVFGEAARVNARTKTIEGEDFGGQMHLFKRDEDGLLPAGYSQTGRLDEVVVPGEYAIQVFWDGHEVGLKEFTVENGEEKEINLVVRTVFVDSFSVSLQDTSEIESVALKGLGYEIAPLLSINQQLNRRDVSTARVVYNIKNVYRPIENASVVLKVYHARRMDELSSHLDDDGEEKNRFLIDEIEVFSVPFLEVGSRSGRYTYVPPGGWQAGSYRFSLDVYGKDGLNYTQGRDLKGHSWLVDIQITKSRTRIIVFALVALAILGVIGLLILRSKKFDCEICDGTGLLVCEKCDGRGRVLIDLNGKNTEVDCKICFGEGLVECLNCNVRK